MSPVQQTDTRTHGCSGCQRRGDQLFAFANGKNYCARCGEQVRGELHIQPLDPTALDHALSAAQGPPHRHDDDANESHGRAPEATAYEEPALSPEQERPARPSPLQPRTHTGTHNSGHRSPIESTDQTVASDQSEDAVPTPQELPSAPQEPRPTDPQTAADPLAAVLAEERHRIQQRRVQLEEQIELIEAELETLTLRIGHVESLLSPDARAA